ncbi:MAG: hypothetical protein RL685_5482 [Pseudomonadota bacterium]
MRGPGTQTKNSFNEPLPAESFNGGRARASVVAAVSLRTGEHAPTSCPAPAAQYRLVFESSSEIIATAGDCLLVIVRQSLSTIGVSAIQRGFEQLRGDHERLGYFSYIEGAHCTAMDAQARGLMADVVRRHTKHIGCAAMVVAGEGFRSTVVRSILTGIHLASRAEHPMRAFRLVEPALNWYQNMYPCRRLAPSALREALLAVYPAARAALR